jgi:hypothetical protein
VLIDLHAHTSRSDGTDSPGALVRRAADRGLDVVAITDHDTFDGWEEAAEVAADVRVSLVRGLEISCAFAGHGAHLLAYLPDPLSRGLRDELGRILHGRDARLPGMLRALREEGIDIDEDDVRRVAGPSAAMGRPHVADALIAKGRATSREDAFERYLGPGRPAYVRRYAADLTTMIGLVAGAGGVTVIAHPWAARHDHRALDEAGFDYLRAAGLAGVEVDHQDHDPTTRARLRALASNLGLVVTGSSDYHGTGKVDHELGCNTTAVAEYERLLALAADSAAAAAAATDATDATTGARIRAPLVVGR